MAWLAVHDKKAGNDQLAAFLPVLEGLADDGRNFVKKAVSWSLRQIGKRDQELNAMTILMAEQIKSRGTSSARWIASDVLRELRSEAVANRLQRRSSAGVRS
jgi:3-methyladenine DNA glycosylase AlkD